MNDLIKLTEWASAVGGIVLILVGFQHKKSGTMKNWWLLVLGGAVISSFAILVLLGIVKLE